MGHPFGSTTLGKVASIDRLTVKPNQIQADDIYVGLENIGSDGRFKGVGGVEPGELRSNKFRFDIEHVLYGKLRPYLAKIARPEFSGICSTDILPIRPGPHLHGPYLFHFLRTPAMVDHAASVATGVNLPRLSPKALAGFEIPLPPIEEQRRIAAVLDAVDELRVKRRQAIAKLDTLTQAIFIDMFGDGEAGEVRRLGDLVRVGDRLNYGVVQPGGHVDDGVPLVRVGDLVGGRVSHARLKRIAPAIDLQYRRSKLVGDEILISCVGSTGTVAIATPAEAGFNIARAIARVPLRPDTDSEFVATQLRLPSTQSYFENELRTVSQPTLNIKQIKETPIFLAPVERQRAFRERLASFKTGVEAASRSRSGLDALFASLQQRAFRGEL